MNNNATNSTNQLQNNNVNSTNQNPAVANHPQLPINLNGPFAGNNTAATSAATSASLQHSLQTLLKQYHSSPSHTMTAPNPHMFQLSQLLYSSTANPPSTSSAGVGESSAGVGTSSAGVGASFSGVGISTIPSYSGIRVRANLYNTTTPSATATATQSHSYGGSISSSSNGVHNSIASSSLNVPPAVPMRTSISPNGTLTFSFNPTIKSGKRAREVFQQSGLPKTGVRRAKKRVPAPATATSSGGFTAAPSTSQMLMHLMPYIPPIHSPPIVTAAVPYPPNWLANIEDTVMSLNTYKKYAIHNDTAEYQTICNMLHPIQVTGIEQIVNHDLWDRFVKTRAEMLRSKTDNDTILKKLGLNDIDLARRLHTSFNFTKDPLLIPYSDNMVLLFHCTRSQANVNSILSQGLDERLSNLSGGLLGKGIYFSDDPKKALQYDGTGSIFIFAVLLGDCISVHHFSSRNAFVREPEKVVQQKRNYNDMFFDSIVARPAGHNEYVIYNRYQCCPIYQIQYVRGAVVAGVPYRIQHISGAARGVDQLSHYNLASQKLPPLAWIPAGPNYALPIQDQKTTQWPFFAVDIFTAMGVTSPTDEDELPEVVDNNTPHPSIDDNLATLINLGYDDEDKNREILTRFNNDLQATVNFFLDNEDSVAESIVQQPPTATVSMEVQDEQPSIIIIDDDDDDDSVPSELNERMKSPPNITVTDDSEPLTIPSMKSEMDLPDEIAEWALEFDPSTVQMEDCPICTIDYESFDTDPTSWQLLECSHKLCKTCYSKILTTRFTMSRVQHTFVKCPFCQGTTGIEIGTCPDMQMNVTTSPGSCEGYSPSSTFVINYTGPSFNRTAYLPNNVEGQEALRHLKTAFERRLCFTIGTSNTTGRNNTIVWNIHHKTAISGGVSTHGFPDPEYLDRLKWELRAFGIE